MICKKSSIEGKNQKGFTLVEILVSSAIIVLITMLTVALLRKSHELDMAYIHHRRARTLIDSCFEDISYHYSNYQTFSAVENMPVIIDVRDKETPDDDLTGNLTVSVDEITLDAASFTTFNYKRLIGTVTWNEPEGQQSISLTKFLTRL